MDAVKSLVTLEFRSVPVGYEFIATLKNVALPFFEVSPQAPGKLVAVLGGDKADVEKVWNLAQKKKKILLDSTLLPQCHSEILPALYGQVKPKVSDYVGVVQTKTLSGALRVAAKILAKGTHLLEIDSGRALNGVCVIYFTGVDSEKTQIQKQLKKLKVDFSLLEKGNGLIDHRFQLE